MGPVSSLPGVGPVLDAALARIGVARVQDLWFHLPFALRRPHAPDADRDLRVGDSAQIEGTIEAVERGFRFRPQLRVVISDDQRAMLSLRFFSFRRAQIEQLTPGTRLRCFGLVRHGAHGPEIVHPQYQRIAVSETAVEECLTPIYPATEGLGQKRIASLIHQALRQLPGDAELELIPPALLRPLRLISLRAALLLVHRPPADVDVAALTLGTHPAQKRLAFEELLTHHLSLKRLRAQVPSMVHRHCAAAENAQGAARRVAILADHCATGVSKEIAADLAEAEPCAVVQGESARARPSSPRGRALAAIESGSGGPWHRRNCSPSSTCATFSIG